MAKQTFTTGQVLTAAQMTSLQQTAMGGGSATAKTASYTLVAADAGTTVIMNSASSTTITVNTGLFAAGDTVLIQNIGAGTCTVTAGTATVSTAGSLALTQYEAGILYFTATGTALLHDFVQASSNPLTTTGDMIYSSSGSTQARLPIGSTSQVLTVASGVPSWATPASGASYAVFADEKASGTNGGTATNGAFRTRDLNTSRVNNITGASLASNQITLPAGTYQIQAFATSTESGNTQTRFYNITDSTVAIVGITNYVANAGGITTIGGSVVITGNKVFELQHRVGTTVASNGFGVAASWGTECYSYVIIAKVA